MADTIKAPFTPEQVEALNRFQQLSHVHPFTCGSGYRTNKSIHPDGEGVLVATVDGWICRNCDYTQDWAHAMMADPNSPIFSSPLELLMRRN